MGSALLNLSNAWLSKTEYHVLGPTRDVLVAQQ